MQVPHQVLSLQTLFGMLADECHTNQRSPFFVLSLFETI